jgi:hypothetical protein
LVSSTQGTRAGYCQGWFEALNVSTLFSDYGADRAENRKFYPQKPS